jgi:hypothetical protein
MLKGPELLHDVDDDGECDYLVAVEWKKHVPLKDAKFRKNAGLCTPRGKVVAKLSTRPETLLYLQQQFKVNFDRLLSD